MTLSRTLFAVSLIVLAQAAFGDLARAHKAVEQAGRAVVSLAPPPHLASEGQCQGIALTIAEVGPASGTRAAKLLEREGVGCAKAGDLTAAIAHFSEAIRHSVWRAQTYAQRGKARVRLGEHEFAVLDFDEAIRLNPDRPRYRYLRAVSLAAIGRAEAAVNDLELVLKLDDTEVVSKLQRHLTEKGYETLVDGQYDRETRRALVACLSRKCIRL